MTCTMIFEDSCRRYFKSSCHLLSVFDSNMSSSNVSAATAYIDALNWSLVIFVRAWSYSMLLLGTIGHSMSVYVFTRASLRSNPCTRYFLAATLSGFLVMYCVILLRLLQWGHNINIFVDSMASCKIFSYLLLWIR